jgi:hypothetical protein
VAEVVILVQLDGPDGVVLRVFREYRVGQVFQVFQVLVAIRVLPVLPVSQVCLVQPELQGVLELPDSQDFLEFRVFQAAVDVSDGLVKPADRVQVDFQVGLELQE